MGNKYIIIVTVGLKVIAIAKDNDAQNLHTWRTVDEAEDWAANESQLCRNYPYAIIEAP